MHTNPYTGTRVEFHILQSFPVTCLNRDDVGAPKTAIIGGCTRARVSSQCWKRQVRQELHQSGFTLGIRSKHIAECVAQACATLGASPVQATECGETLASAFNKDTLLFFTRTEAQAFAEYAQELDFDVEKLKAKDALKEIRKIAKKVLNPAVDGLDIALFGRMVAQAKDDANMNIEAATAFSHAISTHKISNEVEFFTALDDLQQDPGSAHMGSLEFNSATYYRYVSLDLGQLWDSMHGEKLADAVEAFTKALFLAIPTARQTSQSGACPWEYAKILVRKGQRLQVPFETAIKARDGGFLQSSIEALAKYLAQKEILFGSLFGKQAELTYGDNDEVTIDTIISTLRQVASK